MATALTITRKEASGRSIRVYGTIALTGNYAANGDPLALALFQAPTTKTPLVVDVKGVSGYSYEYDKANAKLKVRQQTDPANAGGANVPFVELAAAAYPAGVLADVIQFEAVFPKFG